MLPCASRLDRHDREPGHDRAGRVGAVRRHRDQAGGPLVVAPGLVVGPDDQQPGVLALRAGVGLQRDPGEAGDLGQRRLELAEHQLVALGLRQRREGVQPVELPPAHRHHLGRGVELHGAGAERDHRRGEREVPGLETLDVAQHLGFGVVAVEDRVGQERRSCAGATPGWPSSLCGPASCSMNGSATSSEKTAIRSERSLMVTVSSSATQSRVGVEDPEVDPPGPRARRGSGPCWPP